MYQHTDTDTIVRLADNTFIPPDPGNVDYQAYLAWVAEGNTTEPAPAPSPEELERQELAARNAERVAQQLAALEVVVDVLLAPKILDGTVAPDKLPAVAPLFSDWRPRVAVAAGRVLNYQGQLYEVMTAHTTQADWTPDVATNEFRKIATPGGPECQQWEIWDGHNASLHQVGDCVAYEGQEWLSTIPDNHWRPDEFGWELKT